RCRGSTESRSTNNTLSGKFSLVGQRSAEPGWAPVPSPLLARASLPAGERGGHEVSFCGWFFMSVNVRGRLSAGCRKKRVRAGLTFSLRDDDRLFMHATRVPPQL